MHFEGTLEVAAPRELVYSFLLDPRNLAPCVPGAPPVEQVDPTHYRVQATVGSGFLRAKATLAMEVGEADEPEGAALTARGGAAGGSVEAVARWKLDALDQGRTRIAWSAELTLGGLLAAYGGGIQAAVVSRLDAVVACLRARLAGAA